MTSKKETADTEAVVSAYMYLCNKAKHNTLVMTCATHSPTYSATHTQRTASKSRPS